MDQGEINFEGLPYWLQCSIFFKLNYKSYVVFENCSQFSASMCATYDSAMFPANVKSLYLKNGVFETGKDVPIPIMSKIYFTIGDCVSISDPLTDELCTTLQMQIKRCPTIYINDSVTCSALNYSNLVEKFKVNFVGLVANSTADYSDFTATAIYDQRLQMEVIDSHFLGDQLWTLRSGYVIANNVNFTIDEIIDKVKEWQQGTTKIQEYAIEPYVAFTLEETKAAIAELGDTYTFKRKSPREDYPHWIVSRGAEKKKFMKITYENDGERICLERYPGMFDFYENHEMDTDRREIFR